MAVYKFKQHMPSFMDFPIPPKEDFQSLDDIPIVQRFKRDENFGKLAYDHSKGYGGYKEVWYLMALMKNGKHWVLGYLDEQPESLEKWDGITHDI